MTELPTQLLRQCPQCAQPMGHLSLQGHGAQPVVVDHCAACRLVWFDTLESVHLAGLGWIRLLRELQRGAAGAPTASRPATLACPVCRAALKPVHNATRYGRFPALECPAALADEKRTLNCLNCGAACDGSSDQCSYCASPLLVIDLPRLASALRQRVGHWSASPPPDGAPLSWPCRGCGAALDPSREAACATCGHAVVAPSLLDITPLLTAVEHELRSAEVAARPYRRKEKRPLHWQETGLGMLERFFRNDEEDRLRDLRQGLWVAAALMVLLWLLRR